MTKLIIPLGCTLDNSDVTAFIDDINEFLVIGDSQDKERYKLTTSEAWQFYSWLKSVLPLVLE